MLFTHLVLMSLYCFLLRNYLDTYDGIKHSFRFFNQHDSFYFLIGDISVFFLLVYSNLSLTNYLLILMAYSLSVIDIIHYIVDPLLLSLFSVILLACHLESLNIILSTITFCFFLVISFFLPNQLGFGDIKLLAIWSLILSAIQIIWVLFIASLLGILYIIIYNLFHTNKLEKIAFVPFLSIGLTMVITLF